MTFLLFMGPWTPRMIQNKGENTAVNFNVMHPNGNKVFTSTKAKSTFAFTTGSCSKCQLLSHITAASLQPGIDRHQCGCCCSHFHTDAVPQFVRKPTASCFLKNIHALYKQLINYDLLFLLQDMELHKFSSYTHY